jgi:hypothetical protein
MSYFINKRHYDIFLVFFAIATFGCFLIDFVYGVNIAQMWVWRDYKPIHFLIMFLFMNVSYILGMYELYRVIKTLLAKHLGNQHLLKLYIHHKFLKLMAIFFIVLGSFSLVAPVYPIITGKSYFIEFIMIFPFLALIMLADSVTFLLKGQTLIGEIMRLNLHEVFSIIATIAVASIFTEALNLYGREWEYIKMPFNTLTVFSVPVAVFIGWVPLVISTVCMVNAVKHVSYVYSK